MTVKDLIALVPKCGSPILSAGKAFFSDDVSEYDRRLFIEYLLKNKLYYSLSDMMQCRHLVKEYKSADYLSATNAAETTWQSRYFDLFMQVTNECGVSPDTLMPMLLSCARAEQGTLLRDWSVAVEAYLLRLAYSDYAAVEKYIYEYDVKFDFAAVLVKADRARAVEKLLELALFGKGINKTALRKFLRDYKADIITELKNKYSGLKFAARQSAVRLLLLFKNDFSVSEYLSELEETEPSSVIRKLIAHDKGTIEQSRVGLNIAKDSSKYNKQNKTAELDENFETDKTSFFYDCMVNGTEFGFSQFKKLIADPKSAEVASGLLFGVYNGSAFTGIVVIDEGQIFDTDNKSVVLSDDCIIRILHPTEISGKFAFLKQLNITQPFEQLRRTVFLPSDNNKHYNYFGSLAGTIISATEFKSGLKLNGFKALNKNLDGVTGEAGKVMDGIMCVLKFSPVNLSEPDGKLINVGDVRFYAACDLIRINGQIFTDAVPVYPISQMQARTFSELLHSVYKLLNCL